MKPVRKPHVKICCIQDEDEARIAIEHGASAVGLVSEMPSGPGPIGEEDIVRIARSLPPRFPGFLLTSKQDASAIIAQVRRTGVNTVQLVDRLVLGNYSDLRAALPGVRLVQVVHVTGERSVTEAVQVAEDVDALLLDSGRPDAAVKELGGTGRVHDWSVSRRIRELVPVPVWLAGGLWPGNVAKAIVEVGPYGLDVCSGVRTGGKLDPVKLAAFMEKVRRAAS
jgi:phosphoribosylanthranilate isomerase